MAGNEKKVAKPQLKLKKLRLDNFAKFNNFEVEFNNSITHLVGINGSGKTTVGLTAIWAGIKGISEKAKDGQLIGERFRFIGNAKASADTELTLVDEAAGGTEIKIKNHITKSGNEISFHAPEGYPVSHEWLNELLSVAFLSAKNFTQLSSKEQAIALGIDTSKYDVLLKKYKDEFTLVNREIKSLGTLEVVSPCERIDVESLKQKKQKIRDYLNEQYKANKASNEELRKKWQQQCEQVRAEVEAFNKLQEENSKKYKRASEAYDTIIDLGYFDVDENLIEFVKELEKKVQPNKPYIPPSEPTYITEMPDSSELQQIDEKILHAATANENHFKYNEYLKKKQAKEAKENELHENKDNQAKVVAERLAYIKSFNFGFANLEVDDDGNLQLNGRPLKEPYFSKGELEIIVAKLYAAQNPKLKIRFIDDFELLDEDKQSSLIKELLEAGFQVITAEVGKEAIKDNTILLRECKHVKSYHVDKKKELI